MGGRRAEPLAAGRFGSWLTGMQRALRGEADSDVPCDGCTACCRSAQFVHIEPDETDALAHIPAELLFPAPLRPPGHLVMGYDEQGRCPMLGEDGCTIYEHRPRACRMYDCRVFAATGVTVAGDRQAAIRERVDRWRFELRTGAESARRDALRAAAAYLAEHPDVLPEGAPSGPTQLAVLAVEVHEAFLETDPGSGRAVVVTPAADAVRERLAH
ncbi:MAG TPA: YkgJ family cysteine cluster protein [Acidimicrobiia bacterium]|nr:YkgJ family cysteine cluster protein [Acidimicrobiia bacterium]